MAKKKNKQVVKEVISRGNKGISKETEKSKDSKSTDDFIDDIFADKKRKVETEEVNEKSQAKDEPVSKKIKSSSKVKMVVFEDPSSKSSKIQASVDDGFFDSRGNKGKRDKTEEGFLIYSSKELNIGAGEGDTKDCPFDCQCCF